MAALPVVIHAQGGHMREMPSFTGPNLTGTTQINFLNPVGRRLLRVVRTEELTPEFRRIWLGGEDLAGGFPFLHFSSTDHVKLFFPNPETGELAFPRITAAGWEYDEGAGESFYRDYTVRVWDAEAHELAIDFVIHEHGIAGRWAKDAQVGDEIGVLGPRGNVLLPENYARYVAIGDETALPAVARIIEEAPEESRVTALIEVASDAEVQDLEGPSHAKVIWVRRDSAPICDGHDSALETALRQIELSADESVFVFAAGEAGKMKPIRRYLRRELGFDKDRVDVDGYWMRGIENLDHHDDVLGEDD